MQRGSGILLHLTSLPSPFGIGDLGPSAYRFADFLAKAGQSYWQVLPLNPTDTAHGNSPYSSISALAANPLLISPELLVQDGYLSESDTTSPPEFPERQVDYPAVTRYKKRLMAAAYDNFKEDRREDYHRFCSDHSHWLDDFSLFKAAKAHFDGRMWSEWPQPIVDRDPRAVAELYETLRDGIDREKFLQYVLFKQWFALKEYCNQKGVEIIGDIPIYVSYDSVDVWTDPEIFKLDENKRPAAVAGVPPDYFSPTGQLWGNPVYHWDHLRRTGFAWWLRRMEHTLKLYDLVRVDHFRGLVAYWEVPAGEKTAVNGSWVEVPVEDFFNSLRDRFPALPIIAEDLGVITDEVREVMTRYGFPGMKVLMFAFGDDDPDHPYLPHNYGEHSVVYTGSHDNNTVCGWLDNELPEKGKDRLLAYIGRELPDEDIPREMIRLAMMSVSELAVTPMQDLLGLGEEDRMNRPATADGNWGWRLLPDQASVEQAQKLMKLTKIYGRLAKSA
jgi:4-alpha-glucanotransferase